MCIITVGGSDLDHAGPPQTLLVGMRLFELAKQFPHVGVNRVVVCQVVRRQCVDDRHPLQGVVRVTEQFHKTARTEHPAFCRQLCGTPWIDNVECQDGVFTTKHHISPAAM